MVVWSVFRSCALRLGMAFCGSFLNLVLVVAVCDRFWFWILHLGLAVCVSFCYRLLGVLVRTMAILSLVHLVMWILDVLCSDLR